MTHDNEPDAVLVCDGNGEWTGKLGLWLDRQSLTFSERAA